MNTFILHFQYIFKKVIILYFLGVLGFSWANQELVLISDGFIFPFIIFSLGVSFDYIYYAKHLSVVPSAHERIELFTDKTLDEVEELIKSNVKVSRIHRKANFIKAKTAFNWVTFNVSILIEEQGVETNKDWHNYLITCTTLNGFISTRENYAAIQKIKAAVMS